jgi:hypothetical protein
VATDPHNKKRSDGKTTGSKDAGRLAKGYKATGKVPSRNMEAGNGSKRLAARRFLGFLFDDDDE